MSFTRVVGAGIHTQSNIHSHNIQSTGIITAVGLDINGAVSIAGTLTYEDVTSIDSVGIITARSGIQGIGIQSGGVNVAVGVITALNFIGAGNTFRVNNNTVDISIQGGGGGGGSGAGFSTSNAGLHTTSSIGVNTSSLASTLTGIGNSFQGIYVSNGMMIMDNTLNGNHYIGTTYNGLMAGPVRIEGTLSIDGNYVVV
tara:strand:+ start:109 stop:705 length:597 start_codon:yes stop_codon:yes gene_type:complete